MAKTTLYPFQHLIKENNINVADLPEKIQNRIKKFEAEQDEEEREALDIKIFNDIDDILEKKKADAVAEEKKKKREEAKKKAEEDRKAEEAAAAANGGGKGKGSQSSSSGKGSSESKDKDNKGEEKSFLRRSVFKS